MNMNTLKSYTVKGIIFVLITGTLAHFVYEWSGNNFILGFFFPVNESVWEHMKLSFFPMLLYSFYMNRKISREYPCVTSGLIFGTLLSAFLIPVFFYTYSGILGRNYAALDIGIFIISVLIGFAAVYRLALSCKLEPCTQTLKLFLLITAVCFFVFTYHPLQIGIFSIPGK